MLLCVLPFSVAQEASPIVECAMSREEALAHVDPSCPKQILQDQQVVTLRYYSFDGKLHQGQLVIDSRLAGDIREIFEIARSIKFPIHSVIPLADGRFIDQAGSSDDRSMRLNNTSGFNYRTISGTKRLSQHANGWALDINPAQNPYIKGDTVEPAGAVYDPSAPGTLFIGHPVVEAFLGRGWSWGGNWQTVKDYQHFEKVP